MVSWTNWSRKSCLVVWLKKEIFWKQVGKKKGISNSNQNKKKKSSMKTVIFTTGLRKLHHFEFPNYTSMLLFGEEEKKSNTLGFTASNDPAHHEVIYHCAKYVLYLVTNWPFRAHLKEFLTLNFKRTCSLVQIAFFSLNKNLSFTMVLSTLCCINTDTYKYAFKNNFLAKSNIWSI